MSVLIVPNYRTGYNADTKEWSIINDHDFQLAMMRSQPGDFVCVPKGIIWEEMLQIESWPWSGARYLVHMNYYPTMEENVKMFWRRNQAALNGFAKINGLKAIVNSVPGFRGDQPMIAVYNYLKNDANPTYEDQFFEAKMADFRICRKGMLLTQRDRETVIELAPELLPKVRLNQRCIDPVKVKYFQDQGPATFVRDKNWYLFPLNTNTVSDSVMTSFTGSQTVWWSINRHAETVRPSPARNAYFYGKELTLSEHYRLFKNERPQVVINQSVDDTYDLGWAEVFYFGVDVMTNTPHLNQQRPTFIEIDGTEYSL